ncbi:MAG: TraX family protein [Butyribacter sp.]|nr:TraX family protein [bacterium]MDY3853430.1 TraX family protein [Butyribacter sp.]
MKQQMAIGRNELKLIAVFSMLCDHIGCLFFSEAENVFLYSLLRIIGRLSFVLFCFVLVQGFLSTKNPVKYSSRLLFFALLSEIPFDLAFSHQLFSVTQQNVLFTFWIALLVLMALQRWEGCYWKEILAIVAGCVITWGMHTDYSFLGVLLVTNFYLFRFQKKQQMELAVVLLAMFGNGIEIFAILALPLCYYYAEEKNEKPLPKYFFYLFYPVHLLVLLGIKMLLF